MVTGTFNGNVPLIEVLIAWGTSVQNTTFILDTGFTGDLLVTPEMATNLGLTITGVQSTQIADGSVVNIPTALAFSFMEGELKMLTVLISNGTHL